MTTTPAASTAATRATGATSATATQPASVDLQGERAGPVTRLLAFIVDVIIVLTAFAVLGNVVQFLVVSLRGEPFALADHPAVSNFMLLVFAFAYGAYSLSLRGQTPGKALFGLRVVRKDGRHLGAGHAVLRVLVFPLSFLFLGVGLLLGLLRRDRRALHDLLANTAVIYSWDASSARLRSLARHGDG